MTSSNNDAVKINQIDWLKLFPALHLLKAARLAVRVRVLVPSLLVIVCLAFGPKFETGIIQSSQRLAPPDRTVMLQWYESVSVTVLLPETVSTIVHRVLEVVLGHNRDYRNLWLELEWNLLLVGVFGVAVARAAGTEFCTYSRTGAYHSLRYSLCQIIPLVASTVLALAVAAIFLGPLSLAGWAADSSYFVRQLVISGWLLFSGLAILGVLASVVCLCGWLLSIAAIGVDGCNGADALSRGINYTLSHKLATLFYLLVTAVVSLLTKWVVARIVAAAVIKLNASIPSANAFGSGASSNWSYAASVELLRQLPQAVHWGAFMSGLTIVYVLLRQREDGINLDQLDDAVPKKLSDSKV